MKSDMCVQKDGCLIRFSAGCWRRDPDLKGSAVRRLGTVQMLERKA